MKLFNTIKSKITNGKVETTRYKMVGDFGNGFYSWNGKLYQSDIVRACIRPKTKAIGKLVAKHIRSDTSGLKVNPEPYIRFLLEEPNPYMTGQVMQEKMANQLALNNNAFALIIRDANGFPCEIYPIPCTLATAVYDKDANLYIKFNFINGKQETFAYSDIIHLRQDFNDDDIFGESPANALCMLMDIVCTVDQGIIKAVKNSGIIRWLLEFSQSLRPEDIKKNVKDFVDNYLTIDSETFGAAGVDAKAKATRIEPKDYVPNAVQMNLTTQRIYSFFNTNEKIVQSRYTEDEWNSYYEAEIEPIALQLAGQFTIKIFSRRERGCGNSIVFEASNLACASISTKLGLQAMVDRGALTPNEWRACMNLAPVEGGDKPIRRLDTQVVNQIDKLLKNINADNCNELASAISLLLINSK